MEQEIKSCTIAIESTDQIIGIRYVKNETQVPFIIIKAEKNEKTNLLNQFQKFNIPVRKNESLVSKLYNHDQETIPETTFHEVASELKEVLI